MSDGDDDPQLQSLRAVWLSLPDEEPSQHGLSQLMSAARVKAEQMAKPSLWHRAIEMLRRPPVLALATTLVLIGGVLFVGHRRDKLESESAGHTSSDPSPVGPPATVDQISSAGAAAPASPDTRQDKTASAAETIAVALPDEETTHRPPVAKPRADRDHARAPGGRPSQGLAEGILDEAKSERAQVASPTTGADRAESKTPDFKLSTREPMANQQAAVQPASEDDATFAKDASKEPAIAQLLAQCRSAASRGDCAAVRIIAQRIAKQNAAFYRERVSKDITLTKCLAAD